MYSMENLLTLVHTEKARGLKIQAGTAPLVEGEENRHALGGPPITGEDARMLLRSMANSRQMRELETRGTVTFIYTLQGVSRFLITAKMQGNGVEFVVR